MTIVCRDIIIHYFLNYSCILEWLCTILSGALAMPVGSAVFITLFYHPLHDWFNIHSEVPVLMWITAIFVIVWISDRNPASDSRTPLNSGENSG